MNEVMTFSEFEEKYMKPVKRWDFSKFSIICKKCGSPKVEYNNTVEAENGFYDEIEKHGSLVVKCHDCGNAFSISAFDMVS